MTSAGEVIDKHVQLVRLLMDRDALSAQEAIDRAGPLIPEEDRAEVLQRWESQTSTTIEVLQPIDLSQVGGPRAWFHEWDPSRGYYWRRQRGLLAHTLKRTDAEIDSLDQASNRVLSHLENPAHPDPFLVRGMVIGYVQSGKTANFSAVIAKAADAGYKVVIVLSGLHNTLRKQTQGRLQRDLGHEDGNGVGLPEPGRRWVWMTNAEQWGDFNPHAVDGSVLQGNEQVILVVKKNKSRLQRLIRWMTGRVPSHVPVLVVDDEADQASINTADNRPPRELLDLAADDFDGDDPDDEEVSPSAINLSIRRLLRQFERCSYVAYTATPFANALIDPTARDYEGGEDLFPKDFILSLPPPIGNRYVGPERLFGRERLPGDPEDVETDGLNIIEFVSDHEVDLVVPPAGERGSFVPSLPPSLRQALTDYFLASAGWLRRSGRDQPCTMLVHTDMRRAVQNPLASSITQELARLRQRWMYDREDIRPSMASRWDDGFRTVTRSVDSRLDASFEEIEPDLDRLFRDGVPVRVLNSDFPDTIDFEAEPTLKAILVGGNKLSRGLTVDGLMVSFYVRETLYYDTLLQMGRWFGFRGEYIDLTRIYSTQLLVECFHDLATAEEELRRHIAVYDRRNLKPTALAPQIRKHPLMLVTAKNKMQAARELTVSYDGEFRQTTRFPFFNVGLLRDNLEASRRFLSSLGPPAVTARRPHWESIDWRAILRFLEDFVTIDADPIDPASISRYIYEQADQGELVHWQVLLCSAKQPVERLGYEDLGIQGHGRVPLIERSRRKNDPLSCGVITDPADELHGLADEQIREAEQEHARGGFASRAHAYRAQRPPEEGLLLLYPISRYSGPRRGASGRLRLFDRPEDGTTVIGYAVSFPNSESPATVEYVAGPGRPRLAAE